MKAKLIEYGISLAITVGGCLFWYYQGFYKGADTALCATAAAIDQRIGTNYAPTDEPCLRVKNDTFFWRDTD